MSATREIQILEEIEPFLYDRYFARDKALYQIWPLLRMQLGFENFHHARSHAGGGLPAPGPPGRVARAGALAGRWAAAARELVVDPGRRSKNARADLFFSTYSTSRYSRNARGEHVDAFVSPLVRWAQEMDPGLMAEIEEYPVGGEFRVPRDLPTRYVGLRHLLIASRARLTRGGAAAGMREFLAEARRLAARAGGVCASLEERSVEQALAAFRLWEGRYARRFARLRPRAVFVVTYYTAHGMAMMAAARRVGILTVDLQHGVQGPEHVAYGKWPPPPAGGFRLLPDVFWCWSPADVANIERWAGASHAAVEGGNIWTQHVAEHPGDFPGRAELGARIAGSGRRFRVLATLSPGAPHFLAELREAMASPLNQDVFWMVRLHPGMFAEEAEVEAALAPFHPFCDVALSSRLPLPAALDLTDLHLTEFSSVVLEAEQAGVPSLSSMPVLDYFVEQQQAGTLELRRPGEPAADAVRRCLALAKGRHEAPHRPATPAAPGRAALRALLVRAGVLA